jgi:hypothetical protein
LREAESRLAAAKKEKSFKKIGEKLGNFCEKLLNIVLLAHLCQKRAASQHFARSELRRLPEAAAPLSTKAATQLAHLCRRRCSLIFADDAAHSSLPEASCIAAFVADSECFD